MLTQRLKMLLSLLIEERKKVCFLSCAVARKIDNRIKAHKSLGNVFVYMEMRWCVGDVFKNVFLR